MGESKTTKTMAVLMTVRSTRHRACRSVSIAALADPTPKKFPVTLSAELRKNLTQWKGIEPNYAERSKEQSLGFMQAV